MLKYIVCLISWLATEVHAGTITMSMVTASTPCNGGACTKSYTDTDANLIKIITTYAPLCKAQNLTGSPAAPTDCTSMQTLQFVFDGVIAGIAANVNRAQLQAAIDALPPITPIKPQ